MRTPRPDRRTPPTVARTDERIPLERYPRAPSSAACSVGCVSLKRHPRSALTTTPFQDDEALPLCMPFPARGIFWSALCAPWTIPRACRSLFASRQLPFRGRFALSCAFHFAWRCVLLCRFPARVFAVSSPFTRPSCPIHPSQGEPAVGFLPLSGCLGLSTARARRRVDRSPRLEHRVAQRVGEVSRLELFYRKKYFVGLSTHTRVWPRVWPRFHAWTFVFRFTLLSLSLRTARASPLSVPPYLFVLLDSSRESPPTRSSVSLVSQQSEGIRRPSALSREALMHTMIEGALHTSPTPRQTHCDGIVVTFLYRVAPCSSDKLFVCVVSKSHFVSLPTPCPLSFPPSFLAIFLSALSRRVHGDVRVALPFLSPAFGRRRSLVCSLSIPDPPFCSPRLPTALSASPLEKERAPFQNPSERLPRFSILGSRDFLVGTFSVYTPSLRLAPPRPFFSSILHFFTPPASRIEFSSCRTRFFISTFLCSSFAGIAPSAHSPCCTILCTLVAPSPLPSCFARPLLKAIFSLVRLFSFCCVFGAILQLSEDLPLVPFFLVAQMLDQRRSLSPPPVAFSTSLFLAHTVASSTQFSRPPAASMASSSTCTLFLCSHSAAVDVSSLLLVCLPEGIVAARRRSRACPCGSCTKSRGLFFHYFSSLFLSSSALVVVSHGLSLFTFPHFVMSFPPSVRSHRRMRLSRILPLCPASRLFALQRDLAFFWISLISARATLCRG